jgi:hypothetical protein
LSSFPSALRIESDSTRQGIFIVSLGTVYPLF